MSVEGRKAIVVMLIGFPALILANVWRVPADFPVIQSALDALSEGDTVLVSRGEYGEALEAPPLTFWLLGDADIDTGDFSRPVVDASLTPDSVHRGCLLLPSGSSATVERIRFRNHFDMAPRGIQGGVRLESNHASFRHCSFDSLFGGLTQSQNNAPAVVELDACVFRYYLSKVWLLVSAVHATNCHFVAVNAAYQMGCGEGSVIENCWFEGDVGTYFAHWGSDVTVRGCIFGPGSNWFWAIALSQFRARFDDNLITGLDIGNEVLVAEMDCSPESSPAISRNTFNNCRRTSGATSGMLLDVFCRGSDYANAYRVDDNDMYACSTGGIAMGVLARHRGAFRQNRLHELINAAAPAIRTLDAEDLEFRNNLIYNNTHGLANGSSQSIDARWNWWGDSTGPYHATQNPNGQGDEIQGNVVFEPWYPDTSFLNGVRGINAPLPDQFTLDAYPNPFNSTVTLTLVPSQVTIVKVELFDILGRCVQEIWSGPLAYEKKILYNGSQLSSGIYFVRVWQPIGNRPLALQKLVLLK